jgi:hypothetical protein
VELICCEVSVALHELATRAAAAASAASAAAAAAPTMSPEEQRSAAVTRAREESLARGLLDVESMKHPSWAVLAKLQRTYLPSQPGKQGQLQAQPPQQRPHHHHDDGGADGMLQTPRRDASLPQHRSVSPPSTAQVVPAGHVASGARAQGAAAATLAALLHTNEAEEAEEEEEKSASSRFTSGRKRRSRAASLSRSRSPPRKRGRVLVDAESDGGSDAGMTTKEPPKYIQVREAIDAIASAFFQSNDGAAGMDLNKLKECVCQRLGLALGELSGPGSKPWKMAMPLSQFQSFQATAAHDHAGLVPKGWYVRPK